MCEIPEDRTFERKYLSKNKKRVIKKENIQKEKIKETDEGYRLVFGKNNQNHNRTDINDRNIDNIYGDARPKRNTQEEEEEKVPRFRSSTENTRKPPTSNANRNAFQRSAENSYQFPNSGVRMPPRPPESRESQRTREQQFRRPAGDQNSQGMKLIIL